MFVTVTAIIRIFIIKFVFYVDVMNFCLHKIEMNISKPEISKNEFMRSRRAFTLCWRMCKSINDIFGWGLLSISPFIILGALFSIHNLSIGIAAFKLNFEPIYLISSIAIQTLVTTNTCHKTNRYCSSIAASLHKYSSKENHATIDSYALQLIHQTLIFSAKNVSDLTNGLVISVSFNNSKISNENQINNCFQIIAQISIYTTIFLQFYFI